VLIVLTLLNTNKYNYLSHKCHCYSTAVQLCSVKWHGIYPCFRLCSLSVRWIKMKEHFYKRGTVSHYCVIDWWQWLHGLCKWVMTHKLSHLSFVLYLNRNVQRIHNLPDHEWQEVDSQQHSNCCVEFPWLQVLLCEFEQRNTHTHAQQSSLSKGITSHSTNKDKQPGQIIRQASLWFLDDWARIVFLNVSLSVCVCVSKYILGAVGVRMCMCACLHAESCSSYICAATWNHQLYTLRWHHFRVDSFQSDLYQLYYS